MLISRFEPVLLLVTSPGLFLRSRRASRRLARQESPANVIALLDLCARLEAQPTEPEGHDPVDETLRLVRRVRLARAGRAYRQLGGVYTRLSEEARQTVRERVGAGLLGLVGVLARDSKSEIRRSAMELARESDQPSLIPVTLTLAQDRDPEVARLAQATTLTLTLTLAERRAQIRRISASDASVIVSVLACAERYPEHRIGAVMEAAILVLDPDVRRGLVESELSRWLRGTDDGVRMGLRSALKRAPGAVGRLRAWELLTEPEFRKSAIERLTALAEGDELNALLMHAHLGIRPARRIPLHTRVTRAQRPALFPDHDQLENAPLQARRGLAAWLDAIEPEPGHIDALLEPMLGDEDDAARLMAVRRSTPGLLRDFSLDPCESVARSAALRLLHSGEMTQEHRAVLTRSIHPGVRALVEERPRRQRASVQALRSMDHDRDTTIGHLRTLLGATGERQILEAVRLIRRLGLSQELAPDLIGALERAFRRDDSPAWRVISAILAVIPELPHPAVARLLAAARSHHDARVRATAVEAEPKRSRGRGDALVEILTPSIDDPHHRVQTSALRVLLQEQAAPADTVDRVLGTLASPDQAARAAALWLVERSTIELRPVAGRRWTDLAARVAELARSGEEQSERSRATRCARRMLAEIKA